MNPFYVNPLARMGIDVKQLPGRKRRRGKGTNRQDGQSGRYLPEAPSRRPPETEPEKRANGKRARDDEKREAADENRAENAYHSRRGKGGAGGAGGNQGSATGSHRSDHLLTDDVPGGADAADPERYRNVSGSPPEQGERVRRNGKNPPPKSGKRRRSRPKRDDRSWKTGERDRDGNAPAARDDNVPTRPLRNEGPEESGPSKGDAHRSSRRRRGKRGKKGASGQLRNLRAPVAKVPEARYRPKEGARAHDKQPTTPMPGGRPRRSSGRGAALYAALDLGTNNCRLLVAHPQQRGRFRVVDGFSRIVRLGEGLSQTGELSEAAMDRAVEALKICAGKLAVNRVRAKRLIATEACRQARNGGVFLSRVKAETGLQLEIVDRRTEAYLAAEGCGALMDRKADAAVLFDIGGGSSELVLINRRGGRQRIAEQIVSWISMPIGVVTLAERYGGERVSESLFRTMIDAVKRHLDDFAGREMLADIWERGRVHLLGTSGTVTTLAGIHLKLPRYDRRQVDGLWLDNGDIDRVIGQLLSMSYQQRAASPCVGPERADLVMAGCAILEAIRQTWPSKRLRVADRGLREGMLTQLMERDEAWLAPNRGQHQRGRRRPPFGQKGTTPPGREPS